MPTASGFWEAEMNLQDYLRSLSAEGKKEFRARVGKLNDPKKPIHANALYAIANGSRSPGPAMCRRIVAAANKKVDLHSLRPDIWPNRGRDGAIETLRAYLGG
jgi:hypothetical protein